jgi:hypothetical protein
MQNLIGLSLLGLALTTAGAAQANPGVEIHNAVARVTIIPEARSDVAVSVTRTNPRLPLRIARDGDTVRVDGDLGWRNINCHTLLGHPAASAWGMGSVSYEDMPQIVVRTPLHSRVGASGAVFGSVGPGAGLDLANSGCGDWTVADQNGPLGLRLSGSGDVRVGTVASANVQISGSSDVRMGAARGGLVAAISGSGDVTAQRVDGPLRAQIGGSGDVRIRDGAVTDMSAQVAGSGDVHFGGVAHSLEANIAGSGDVSAGHVTGSVTKHVVGSGDVSYSR